jgi:hypothetical protein
MCSGWPRRQVRADLSSQLFCCAVFPLFNDYTVFVGSTSEFDQCVRGHQCFGVLGLVLSRCSMIVVIPVLIASFLRVAGELSVVWAADVVSRVATFLGVELLRLQARITLKMRLTGLKMMVGRLRPWRLREVI